MLLFAAAAFDEYLRTSLLADHLQIGGGNRHRATLFRNVAGELNLVAQVRHEFGIVIRGQVAGHSVNLAVGRKERYRLSHLSARWAAIRRGTIRHLMVNPSVRLIQLVAGLVDELTR